MTSTSKRPAKGLTSADVAAAFGLGANAPVHPLTRLPYDPARPETWPCALAYVRRSIKAQEDDISPTAQREAIERWAQTNHVRVIETYSDLGRSAFKLDVERPAWGELLARVAAERIDFIVAYRADRFTRQGVDDMSDIERSVHPHGAVLVTTNNDYDSSRRGLERLPNFITSTMSELESQRLSERVSGARKVAREAGGFTGGTPPYGFTIRRVEWGSKGMRALTPEPAEAAVIRDVIARVRAGATFTDEAKRLNAAGVASRRGAGWSRATVRGMVSNPAIAGYQVVRTGGSRAAGWEIVRGQDGDYVRMLECEPIVEPADWWGFMREVEPRATTQPSKGSMLGGRGLLVCASCGGPMSGVALRGRAQYRCSRMFAVRGGVARCSAGVTVDMHALDDEVRQQMASLVGWLTEGASADREIAAGILASWSAAHADPTSGDERAELERTRGEVEARILAVEDDRAAGLYDGRLGIERFRRTMSTLQRRLSDVEAKLERLPDTLDLDTSGLADWAAEYARKGGQLSDADVLDIAKYALTGIVVTRHEAGRPRGAEGIAWRARFVWASDVPRKASQPDAPRR